VACPMRPSHRLARALLGCAASARPLTRWSTLQNAFLCTKVPAAADPGRLVSAVASSRRGGLCVGEAPSSTTTDAPLLGPPALPRRSAAVELFCFR